MTNDRIYSFTRLRRFVMVTRTAGETASKTTLETGSFERFASICAILAGIGSLLYGIAFVVLKNGMLSSLFLMLGGLLSTVVLRLSTGACAQSMRARPYG